ncbi:MAG: carboxypeptidase-like regulatory domain-containing protein [Isosphaeraceae bacterium]
MKTINPRVHRAAAPLVAALLLALVGCGESGPKLVPVSGVVTLNGKPLEGAEVSFVPDPTNKDSTPGNDKTGPEGNYKAMFQGRSGLAPGKYVVLISKKADAPPGIVLPPEMQMDTFQQEMAGLRKETLPSKYTDAMKTEQPPIEVGENGGTFDFDVKASSKSLAEKK